MASNAQLLAELSGPDPFPALERLRSGRPVQAVELPNGSRVWLITRYEDARRALADPRLSNRGAPTPTSGGYQGGPTSQHMLAADPPDHTRLRRLVSAGFTARRVERLEPRIRALATQLLDAMAGHDEVDLVDAYAFPLPIQVICELLGVPSDDRDSFRAWSNTLVTASLGGDTTRGAQVRATTGEMVGYIRQLLADKRRAPADDMLSALVNVRDEGDRLTEDELVSMVFLMLIAGHETTVNLIANGVYLLLTHPAQRRRVVADPSLLPAAVEEFLRYEPPVKTTTFRMTTEPVEYGGIEIPAHQPVLISLLSANRDDSAFTDPGRFDVARGSEGHHLAFGHGVHFCLGAALARLEGRIAIGSLLERYPGVRLADPSGRVDWRPGMLIRGPRRLPVRLA